jgi:hypothetical protein
MYLLYVDESGDSSSRYFVAAGVLVHEQDAYGLASRLETAMARLGPEWATLELHAQLLRTGKGPWRRLAREERSAFQAGIPALLVRPVTVRRGAVLFAIAVERSAFPAIDPVERAYEELFLRVDSYLGRLHAAGDSHRCIVISDETHLEKRLQLLMHAWRTMTGRVRRLSAFAEVPLFADSAASRLVQFADFVAHWTYRRYESEDPSVFDELSGSFDRADGVVHGLMHMTGGRTVCPCPACTTRRGRPRSHRVREG